MPNWCENSLTIRIDPNIKGSIEYARKLIKAYKKNKLLDAIKKMPKHQPNILLPNAFDRNSSDGGIIMDWYNWSINNWGTKWDITNYENGDELEEFEKNVKNFETLKANGDNVEDYPIYIYLYFQTAWSPPTIIFNNEKFNKFVDYYEMSYFESGQGYIGTIDKDYGDRYIDITIPVEVASDYDALRNYLEDELSANSLSEDLIDNFNLVDIYYSEQEEESFETK